MLPHAHIERAKGTTAENIAYCSKEKNFVSTFPPSKKERALQRYPPHSGTWRPWQQVVIDYVNSTPQPREIMWIWESRGNTGKSWLAKYLFLTYQAILAGGCRKDVFHQVVTWMEKNEADPALILIDVPRDRMKYFQYSTLEALKDGLGASGKYESCCFWMLEPPHVIVFSNSPPDEEAMSQDRWKIVDITDYLS